MSHTHINAVNEISDTDLFDSINQRERKKREWQSVRCCSVVLQVVLLLLLLLFKQ